MKTTVGGVYINESAPSARPPINSRYVPVRSSDGALMMRRLISLASEYGDRLTVSAGLVYELAKGYRAKSKLARRAQRENAELSRQLDDARREIEWLRAENIKLRNQR